MLGKFCSGQKLGQLPVHILMCCHSSKIIWCSWLWYKETLDRMQFFKQKMEDLFNFYLQSLCSKYSNQVFICLLFCMLMISLYLLYFLFHLHPSYIHYSSYSIYISYVILFSVERELNILSHYQEWMKQALPCKLSKIFFKWYRKQNYCLPCTKH